MSDLQTIKMVNGRILVKQHVREERTAGGLYIPQSNDNPMKDKWTVVAVADGIDSVKIGDVLLVDPIAAAKHHIDDEIYYVVEMEDVIAVFQKVKS